MSDSSGDDDILDGLARAYAVQYQRRNNVNVDDPRDLPGPSGVVPGRPPIPPNNASGAAEEKSAKSSESTPKKTNHEETRQKSESPQSEDSSDNSEDYLQDAEYYRPSNWFTQETPQKTYFPQIGDDVVYFPQGHANYLSVVKSKHPQYYVPTPPVPFSMSKLLTQELCRVTKVEFVMSPARMCKLRLYLYRRNIPNGPIGGSFTVYYHPVPDASDFLVLINVYNQSILVRWRVGQRFRCITQNNTWRRGLIRAIAPVNPQFPQSAFHRFIVRWDDGTVGRVSPWDLATESHECIVNPRHATIEVEREDLHLWRGVLNENHWPFGSRERFLEAIGPKMQQLLDVLRREFFILACRERTDPDFLSAVAYPVDFSLIVMRLDSGFYRRLTSVFFDISYILRNALKIFTVDHIYAKIARMIADLLVKIIRNCRNNIPLRAMFLQSLEMFIYSDSDSEEERQRVRRRRRVRRVHGPRVPNEQALPNGGNQPPIVQEIPNNEIPGPLERPPQNAPLGLHQYRLQYKSIKSKIQDRRRRGRPVMLVNLNDFNLFVEGPPQEILDGNVRPVAVVDANEIGDNQPLARPPQQRDGNNGQSPVILNVNDNNQLINSQEHDSDNSEPLALVLPKGNSENQQSTSYSQQRRFNTGRSPGILKANGNDEHRSANSHFPEQGCDNYWSLVIANAHENNGNQSVNNRSSEEDDSDSCEPLALVKPKENGENQPTSCSQEQDRNTDRSASILKAKDNDENQPGSSRSQEYCSESCRSRAILEANGNAKKQQSINRALQQSNDTERSMANLTVNENDERPTTSPSREQESNNYLANENGKNQPTTSHHQEPGSTGFRLRDSSPEEDENSENQPSSNHPRKRVSRNDLPSQAVLRASENVGSQTSNSSKCKNVRKKYPLRVRPRRLSTSPVSNESKEEQARQCVNKRKSTRRRIVLKERNIESNHSLEHACTSLTQGQNINLECQHQGRSSGTPRVLNVDCNVLSINRSQEHDCTPVSLSEIDQNQPSTSRSQEHVRSPPSVRQERVCTPPLGLDIDTNHPSTSRSQERIRSPPVGLEIDTNQASTSRSQDRIHRPPSDLHHWIDQNQPSLTVGWLPNHWHKRRSKKDFFLEFNRRQQAQGSVDRLTPVRKFPSKRSKETSSSDSTTNLSSDSDTPAVSTYKGKLKRARMQKISKMKEWMVHCMRVLQTLWKDEDAAMFRQSAMENHRRSVIEWVSLEYIMDCLKSGAYEDPYVVVDEVHTMLLHGRSLISDENAEISKIIDKLSLLFDELIDPVLQKWDASNVELDGQKDKKEHGIREETHTDVAIAEVSSSSSPTMPKSTPPQSP